MSRFRMRCLSFLLSKKLIMKIMLLLRRTIKILYSRYRIIMTMVNMITHKNHLFFKNIKTGKKNTSKS